MRIVVPTWTVDERKGGIRTYLVNLVAALRARPDVELRLLCSPESRSVFAPTAAPGELVSLAPPGGRWLRPVAEQWVSARIGRQWGDVLLTPSNVGLLGARIPQVVIVQSPLAVASIRAEHPTVPVDAAHRAYHRSLLGPSLRRAAAVVTVTEWMRAQLLRSVRGLQPDRIHVVPEGVRPADHLTPRRAASGHRILFVSTLFPYKGADLLLAALGQLRTRRPDLEWSCRVVGRDPSDGATTRALREHARSLGIDDRVELVGSLPHDRIWNEYADASVFVYPSELESFGLPPLEAMMVGIPVITSTAPSVREVVGDAGRAVDVHRPAEFADVIGELLGSEPARRQLREAGRALVASRTWDAAAAGIVSILRLADSIRGNPRAS